MYTHTVHTSTYERSTASAKRTSCYLSSSSSSGSAEEEKKVPTELAEKNPHPRDTDITFDEGPHIYTVYGKHRRVVAGPRRVSFAVSR